MDPSDFIDIERPLMLYISVKEAPLEQHKSSCWRNLFDSGIVAKRERWLPESSAIGKGLGVSFEDLLVLASIDYSATIDKTIVLLGYRTALLPVEIHEDYTQYHLLVCHSGQMDPYQFPQELSQAAEVTQIEELQKRTCFVGWCGEASIRLGTDAVTKTSMPRNSGAERKAHSIQLHSIALGLSVVSAAPVQAGPTFQMSGKFIVNRIQFPFSDVYSQILRDTSEETVLLYDTASRQGWVVPKLYLLLHMCHTHMAIRDEHDPIPFAADTIDLKSLIGTLDQKGDLVLYGAQPDELRFRTLLRGLNVNMLTAATKTHPARGDTLYGYEFLDMVNGPGRGAWMKKINVKSNEITHIAKLVDAVVVGAGFGDVIKPTGYRAGTMPGNCITVPGGFDYLAIPVSCLLKFASGRREINDPTACYVEISDDLYWVVSIASFTWCDHSKASEEVYWLREQTFQGLRCFGWLRRRSSVNGHVSLPPIPGRGAVVFGRPQRR
jgi:hypothetical protein